MTQKVERRDFMRKLWQRMSGIGSPGLVSCGNLLGAYGEPDTTQTNITTPACSSYVGFNGKINQK